jgi:hypothetical protein
MLAAIAVSVTVSLFSAHFNRYYLGVWTGGLYRSDNRGVTWYFPNPTFGNTIGSNDKIVALDVDPTNADRLLAALCDSNINPCQVAGARLFRSTDGGVIWTPLPGTGISASAEVRALVFARDVANRVYLATSVGVYRSTDGGSTWAQYGGATQPVNIRGFAPAPSNSNYVYAGAYYYDPGVGSWQLGAATGSFLPAPGGSRQPREPARSYGGKSRAQAARPPAC